MEDHSKDGLAAAHQAGLRYISDQKVAGITRHGKPGHFSYRTSAGARLRDAHTLARIAALAIPPAWTEVWIAPFENAHLTATGRDARGRKQYRYHPDFAAVRDATKYEHLARFAQSLPALRRRLKADLRLHGLPREKVLAAIVTLLEETLIRIGNEDYARDNGSFGLTTLRNRHVTVRGAVLQFAFQGKSGKSWNLSLHDRRVARIIRSCQDLPGQHLFEYRDADGAVQTITSTEVNAYLRQISGEDISAKDFRTWAGTVEAAHAFHTLADEAQARPTAKAVRGVVAKVAAHLGNTVAVCRKCYIHPAVIAGFEAGRLRLAGRGPRGLSAAEQGVLAFLKAANKNPAGRSRRARP